VKDTFIDITLEELKDGDLTCKQITKGKFDSVIIPAFCRPCNLRMLVLHKVQQRDLPSGQKKETKVRSNSFAGQ